MRNFVKGLKAINNMEKPLKICCGNSTTIFFSRNNKVGNRSKPIDIKYLVVRGHMKKNEVVVEHIKTNFIIADPMTKGLAAKVFGFKIIVFVFETMLLVHLKFIIWIFIVVIKVWT